MKKIILFTLSCFLLTVALYAQVGINTDNSAPDSSAMLDVKSTSKGLLAPRVELTAINSASPISLPATGLLVYNIATAGTPPNDVIPGFYCWNGIKWISVLAPEGTSIGDMLYWNGSKWVRIPVGSNGQVLTLSNGIPTWGGSQVPVLYTSNVTNISSGQAISGGSISHAGGSPIISRGICWSTTPNPDTTNSHTSDSSGIGNIFISQFVGLLSNTVYYVRSYAKNSIGVGYGNQLSFQTLPSCGQFTVNHIAGDVAPVNKTVTYNTVKNIPGELGKCWTVQNLGADHMANTVNDATEASAGWYWRFDRKQGYKQDGTNPPPYWNNNMSYGSDWLPDNDPCRIEMGNPWRVPTQTEWNNVSTAGGWSNWNGPWTSGLSLHSAGYIEGYYNNLNSRGTSGHYWSSTNYDYYYYGWALTFNSNSSYIYNSGYKAYGFSIRCIKDTCSSYNLTGVSISPSNDTVCFGSDVTFTATPVNGGSSPIYQWKVNGGNAGDNSPTFSYIPVNGNVVTCEFTSSSICTINPVTSNSVTLTVLSQIPSPNTGSHPTTPTEITWNWYMVAEATGYKWNTSDDYSTAIDIGNNFSYTETGLNPTTYYTRYIWAYNNCGYSIANSMGAQTTAFSIGLNYGGGVIFYIDATGQHGLIAATTDQTPTQWGCYGTNIGGTSIEIGTGQANTLAIVNGCNSAGIAAQLCNDLVQNGYSDWYLPSLNELNLMFQQRYAIGGFQSDFYWSSSEFNANNAWNHDFSIGNQYNFNKSYGTLRIRAIRSF